MEEKWRKFKLASQVGSLFQISAGLCFASVVPSGWNGLCPDFAWVASAHHSLNTDSLWLGRDLPYGKLLTLPPSPAALYYMILGLLYLCTFHSKKVLCCLCAYCLLCFPISTKVQVYEDRSYIFIYFYISIA